MDSSKKLATLVTISLLMSTVAYAKTLDYEVVSGDTLYIIAKKNHTTVKELKAVSGLTAADTLKLGQQIKVPVDTYFPDKVHAKSAKMTAYKVVPGDTLYIVAKKNMTTTDKIRQANGMKKGQLIRVGQLLQIPGTVVSQPLKTSQNNTIAKNTKIVTENNRDILVEKSIEPKVYVVLAGDTLYSIARSNHMTTDKIRLINGMSKKQLIKVGQRLKLSTAGDMTIAEKKTKSLKASPLKHVATLKETATLKNPVEVNDAAKTKQEMGAKTYKVISGDSLSMIAKKYGLTTKALLDMNSMNSGNIRIGQILKLTPSGKKMKPVDNPIKGVVATKGNKRLSSNKKKESASGSIVKKKIVKKEKLKKPVNKIHIVKGNDTLYSIAKNNHISLKRLLDLNGMRGNYSIKVGQRLNLGSTVLTNANEPSKPTKIAKKKIVEKKNSKKIAVNVKSKRYKVRRGDSISVIAKNNNLELSKLLKLNKLTKRSKLKVGQILVLDASEAIATHTKTKKIKTIAKVSKKKSSSKKRVARKYNRKKRYRGSNAKVIRTAKRYLGRRYVWGATGPSKFDCSGFTQYVLRKSKGVRIPRVSRQQAYYGKYVSRRNLRAGDLVFFDTSRRRRGYVNHVGIYIGNNQFIHASSARHRVVITSLNRPFYRARFKWGRRVN